MEEALIDSTERTRAEEAVKQANLGLRQLAADLLRSQDYERRRISKELHDGTAQLLVALSMTLCYLRDAELSPERRGELLAEAIDLAARTSREIRVLSYLLHPPLLDELGLAAALASYAKGYRQRAGIEIEVDVAPDFGRLRLERNSGAELQLARRIGHGGESTEVGGIDTRSRSGEMDRVVDIKPVRLECQSHSLADLEFIEPFRHTLPVKLGCSSDSRTRR